MNKLVSIIVPCYNQVQYLDEALQSVYDQTYQNWECIIVNDGSPDHTEEVSKKWIEKDNRFKYIYQENGGLSSARNIGLENAKGDYIQFLDADDFLDAKKIELSLEIDTKCDEDTIVISNFRMFTDDVVFSTKPFCELKQEYFTFQELLFGWENKFSIPIHCGFFSKSLLEGFKFPEELKAKEDWIMWLEIFQKKYNCHFLDRPLVFYRKHFNSMTKDEKLMNESHLKAILVLKEIVPQEVYNEYLFFVLKQKNKKIINLEKHINNYKKSKGYKILEKVKNNSFILFLIKLRNKIC